jgi:membrane protein YdbS with pleckstrin-like domain
MKTETKPIFVQPHPVTLLLKFFLIGVFWTVPTSFAVAWWAPDSYQNLFLLGILISSLLSMTWSVLGYMHTKTFVNVDGIIVQQGWVPQTRNAIFWLHLRDVNARTGVLEALFGCGTVILRVQSLPMMGPARPLETICLKFLPEHTELFECLREKIADQTRHTQFLA